MTAARAASSIDALHGAVVLKQLAPAHAGRVAKEQR